MQFDSWLAFCSIAFIATVTPGPAILLVMTHSMQYGVLRALATICGNISGLFLMSALSAAGLSAIILVSSFAFTVIKSLGAIYLFYLGFKLWRSGLKFKINVEENASLLRFFNLYTQGLLIALTNPKAIIFTIALFPQFISPESPIIMQFFILVVSFMALSFTCLVSYSLLSAKMNIYSVSEAAKKWLGKTFASLFFGAGAMLLVSSQKQ